MEFWTSGIHYSSAGNSVRVEGCFFPLLLEHDNSLLTNYVCEQRLSTGSAALKDCHMVKSIYSCERAL